MHFLLTRPQQECRKLAQDLADLGHRVDYAPVFTINYYDRAQINLDRFQAILFTSVNGVRAFVRNNSDRDIACFVVGMATAQAAVESGFGIVLTAEGNVKRLTELVIRKLRPEAGPLLHISARDITGNLSAILTEANFTVIRKQLYMAQRLPQLPPKIPLLITAGAISHIPLYSPRSAKIFADLITAACLDKYLPSVSALCLSPAVANMIGSLGWRKILTADQPNQTSLFKLVKITFKENRQ